MEHSSHRLERYLNIIVRIVLWSGVRRESGHGGQAHSSLPLQSCHAWVGLACARGIELFISWTRYLFSHLVYDQNHDYLPNSIHTFYTLYSFYIRDWELDLGAFRSCMTCCSRTVPRNWPCLMTGCGWPGPSSTAPPEQHTESKKA